MIIIITALLSSLITTIIVNEKITSSSSVKTIAEGDGTTGIETALASIRTMLEDEYIGELNDEQMLETAIKGYVAGVGDEYTVYYTPDEMKQEYDNAMGNYVGIGIYMVVNYKEGTITVVEPMKGSPAEAVGIQEGDLITKVEGETITPENVNTMSNKIKGEEGTKVKLEITRDGKTQDVEVERKKIEVSHIESKMLENNIAYIQILDFDGGTAKEFKKNYEDLKSKGATSLIIDIRSNGGGVVDEAIDILTKQFKNKKYKKILSTLHYDLTIGRSFSEALARQEKAFPSILVNMVKTAEMTGELPETLDDMEEYFTEIEETRKAMVTAMMYPTIIFIIAIAVGTFIMLYVVPKFVEIYNTMDDAQIPGITTAVLNFSDFLQKYIIYIGIGVVLFLILFIYLYN